MPRAGGSGHLDNMSCAHNFIESASTVACIDGAWEEQTCIPDKEFWSTGSVLLGAVASALGAIPLAIYGVFKKGHIASHIFAKRCPRTGFSYYYHTHTHIIGAVLFDTGEIVTDTLVAFNVPAA